MFLFEVVVGYVWAMQYAVGMVYGRKWQSRPSWRGTQVLHTMYQGSSMQLLSAVRHLTEGQR
jgi:hypothetical protein